MEATSMIRVPVMLSIRSIIGLQPSAPGALQLYGCGYLGERYCRCKKVPDFPYDVRTIHLLTHSSKPEPSCIGAYRGWGHDNVILHAIDPGTQPVRHRLLTSVETVKQPYNQEHCCP
jgi:hypothetical protein